MKEIKKVYIAGKITPTSRRNHSLEHLDNIGAGIDAGIMLMKLGFSVYNPFLDFQYALSSARDKFLTVERIRKMDLDWVIVSDAVFLLPGWKKSVGARGEVEAAKKANIPCFESIDALVEYRERMAKEEK